MRLTKVLSETAVPNNVTMAQRWARQVLLNESPTSEILNSNALNYINVLKNDDGDDYLISPQFQDELHNKVATDRSLLLNKQGRCMTFKVALSVNNNVELRFLYRLLKEHSGLPLMVVGNLVPESMLFSESSDNAMVEANKIIFYKNPAKDRPE